MKLYNWKGKPVGDIEGATLVKAGLDAREHMLRKPMGWATDEEHLELAIRMEVTEVRLVEKSGRVWTAPLATFMEYGQPIDRGHGKQIVLPAKHWKITDP